MNGRTHFLGTLFFKIGFNLFYYIHIFLEKQ